ncbi:actin binding protein [Cavenderia fasciculata]|uniref:Coronin n=1 Tax=Cavenderia fasciculata TaxID=261658 RepID=F4PPL5_CACFS|nr:actin binding protein [Cavenderia fasciculata]EGG22328.1 actin binding protein [Cavenderia fasciculata]|eukprot:XP_004360179.1 actin binding protein [Cavenderia fasciculata]
MSKVVRSSKYRHVFGTQAKKEECFQNLKVTRSAWDSNYIAANTKYFAVIWEAGGGGSFAVLPQEHSGKNPANIPLFAGHKNPVLDVAFHPFNENLVCSVSEDCNVMIWGIPEGGLTANITEPLQTLTGHKRKVGTAIFNPVANNVLATSSGDFSVKTWDVEQGSQLSSIDGKHSEIILSVEWNYNGSQVVTTCKDKKVRVFDPRSNDVSVEAVCHQGVKNTRGIFVKDNILTTGFSKTSEREFKIWDPRNIAEPITATVVDTASGLLMPFYDQDNSILYMVGKGDGNIRYYEMVDEAPYFHFLSEFKSATPQRGVCFLPKRALNVSECEIARALKVTTNGVEPISFRAPRRSDIFQDDLFPDTYAGEAVLEASQWAAGQNAEPKTMSLAPGFTQKKVVQDFKPVVQKVEGPKNEKELREEYEKLKTRVAYLESEIVKKDAKIAELTK